MSQSVYHTAILGAGASGLMCAGSFNQPKIIIEHNKFPGAKINVSGGGKCNFTNLSVTSANYLSGNKHFCKNALAAFSSSDFLNLLKENFISWREKEAGQLFAFDAKQITDMLYQRAKKNNTEFLFNTQLLSVFKEKDVFHIHTSSGLLKAYNVVVATGGLSFPFLGASNFGFKTAKSFGLNVVEQSPALVGVKFCKPLAEQFKKLAGNSVQAAVRAGNRQFTGSLLFTHDGVSGPAVLQASLFWTEGAPLEICFQPDIDWAKLLQEHKNSAGAVSSVLATKMPLKIVKTLLGGRDRDIANATKAELADVVNLLSAFSFIPAGTGGYTKAEVTAGGVDTREINPTTMQTRKCEGLFFTGEVLDVTGMLGGYNLQWAWSSGFAAAKALENR